MLSAFTEEFSPRLEEVVGDDWRDAWKEHFAPFRLSTHVVVRPPWREAPLSLVSEVANSKVLELEPGRAFGTGLHQSTALVAQLLDRRSSELASARVLDLGCGSGILSLVALSLGAATARALDVDADAVRVALENAARNALSGRLFADTTALEALDERYPIVLANIQAAVLVPKAKAIMACVAEGGLLVLSGILTSERDVVARAYQPMIVEETPILGEWVALALRA
ncbi:MAG: hypothetical protein NVS3B20_06810 [Polyangiales bacterium]